MGKKHVRVINPAFDEFVFDVIANSTQGERSQLTDAELKKIQYGAKKTVAMLTNLDLEEKILLLAKLGVPFHMVFGEVGSKRLLSDIYAKHKAGKDNAAMEEAMDMRLHVVSDKQLIKLLNVLSGSFASENYLLNRDYLRLGYKVREWRKKQQTGNAQIREATQGAKDLAKMLLTGMCNSQFTEGLMALNEAQLAVMLVLFKANSPYVTDTDIKAQLVPAYGSKAITAGMRSCVEMLCADRIVQNRRVEYCATALGIDLVMKYQRRILNQFYS